MRPSPLLIPLAILALFSAFSVAAPRAQTPGPAAPVLVLSFTGIKSPNGAIMAAVFDSESAYAEGSHPVRAVRLVVAGSQAQADILGLPPGRYAVKAFHDLTGSGQLTFNVFGSPTEPVAFSNNAKVNLRAPSWTQTVFDLALPKTVQTITID
jgi:uncharacterized protein (DUF2141 family)